MCMCVYVCMYLRARARARVCVCVCVCVCDHVTYQISTLAEDSIDGTLAHNFHERHVVSARHSV